MPRRQKTIHYLYKTTCLVTGRYYIGMHSTNNLDDGYMGSGRRLRASIRKHGKENHVKEILEFFETRELLVEAEKEAITPGMVEDENCMNLMGGGEGGYVNDNHYEMLREKASDWMSKKWEDDEFRGMHLKLSGERMKQYHKEGRIRYNTFTGKKHSDETKQKMAEKAKERVGKKNSQYGTCWITNGGENKKINKEYLNQWLKNGWERGREIKK